MIFFCRKPNKQKINLCVKEMSFYIHQYNHKRYDKGCIVLKIAHNTRKQKKRTEKVPMTWITWKLNIVWLFLSYEQSSIRDCQPNIVPALKKYNNMSGSPTGLEDKGFSQRWTVLKLPGTFPWMNRMNGETWYKNKYLVPLKKNKRTAKT